MRRMVGIGLVVLALAGAVLAPAGAQDGFTPEEQAALDEIRAAYENFLALETFSADIEQVVKQNITVTQLGQTVDIVQEISAEGEAQVEYATGGKFPNQYLYLTENIVQEITGAGESQPTAIGPLIFEMITLDNRIYLRVETPPEMVGLFPSTWQDITEGASVFPGMEMLNMAQLMELTGASISQQYIDGMLASTLGIELLGADTVNGVSVNRYRLRLDLETMIATTGMSGLEEAFNAEQLGLDVEGFLALIYDRDSTQYEMEIAIDAENPMVIEFVRHMITDVEIGPEFFTDDLLEGAEMAIFQDIIGTFGLRDFNEPVTFEAPELGQ